MELSKKLLKRYSKNELIEIILVLAKETKSQAEQTKAQREQIKAQREQIKGLEERIRRLEKDSETSSKPPSEDKVRPKRTQSLREKSGKPPGGQKGHKGKTREQVSNPDKIISCYPEEDCKKCGNIAISI